MALWLKSHNITNVVMEATGSYWLAVYETLEAHGIKAVVVDARQASRMPGKKSDVLDCLWLQQLASAGLLAPCFVPEARLLDLRSYRRHRQNLVELCSQQILMMQKALTNMNVQLHQVLSDITGVSGMKILRAIIGGQRDPEVLASYCHSSVKADQGTIVKALGGNWSECHLMALGHALQTYDRTSEQLLELDERIALLISKLAGSKKQPDKAKGSRKNMLRFDIRTELTQLLGVDLTTVEGFEVLTVIGLLGECGTDLSSFPSDKHFASWLGLAPNHRITGGKVRSRHTRQVSSGAALIFRLAAQSLCRSRSGLGAFLRSVAARRGMPKAIIATARKLAVIYYNLMTKGGAYTAKTTLQYEEHHRQRKLKKLHKLAFELGFQALPVEPDSTSVS